MSRVNREALMMELGMEAAGWQEDVQRFDSAVALLLGLNATDLRCAFLLTQGALTAKDLARGTGLTPGAVTTVIDRLERAGLARRGHDPIDRRRLQIELTEKARAQVAEIWGPLVAEGVAMMKRYSTAELTLLRKYVGQVRAIQQAHTARIEARLGPAGQKA